ncbi:MAG: hypothetical protein LBJ92_04010 [Holosporales bacterium]|nr:hypothetical protein [Holosporales bacterium]
MEEKTDHRTEVSLNVHQEADYGEFEERSNNKNNFKITVALILIGIVLLAILYYRLPGEQAQIEMHANYIGISGATLAMCTIFIITAAGISFLITHGKMRK